MREALGEAKNNHLTNGAFLHHNHVMSITANDDRRLCRRVELAREKLGVAASEVDRLAGGARGTTRKIETGAIGNPRALTLKRIADVLGVRLSFLCQHEITLEMSKHG